MTEPFVQFGVAVLMGREHEAIEILARGGVDPNGPYGRTPLGIAAEHGRILVMKALLERGARVDKSDAPGGASPLWWATVKNHPLAIEVLLQHGAAVDIQTSGNETPLFRAAKIGLAPAVLALIDGSADVNHRGPKGETPLIVAVKKETALFNPDADYDEVIDLLLRHGADRDARTEYGHTASSLAELREDSALAKRVASAGG